jgi:MFS family permease
MTAINRIATTWYAYGYLREAVLIYPVYAIMLGEHGIDAMALSTLFIVWAGSALIFELPAGVMADRYSRKWLLVISGAIKGTTFIVWWASPDFTGYLLGFVLWGAGSSLVSGTAEAYVYDSLTAVGAQNSFARVYGRGLWRLPRRRRIRSADRLVHRRTVGIGHRGRRILH